MKLKRCAALTLAIVIVSSASGCGRSLVRSLMQTGQSSSSSGASVSSSQVDELKNEAELEQASVEKFNAYIAVNNFLVGRLNLVINSYFDRVEFQEEFALSGSSYWCNSIGESYLKKLEAAHEFTSQEPHFSAVEASFEAMYPVLKEMMTALDAVYTYTDLKSYLDDDYVKAKEQHAIIWRTYNEYEPLGEAFMAELEIIAQERREKSLQQFLDEDMPVHHALLSMLMSAQAVQSNIMEQGVTDANLTELDLEQLQPLYDDFTAKVEACMTYLSDAEQLKKEGWMSNAFFSMFNSNMRDTKVALTELIQRVKENDPLEYYEMNMLEHTSGTISKFESKLNALIGSYNNL